MRSTCIICGARGLPERIRDMAMLRCPSCSFLWLAEKILSDDYYEDVDAGVDAGKMLRRKRNMLERIQTFKQYIPSFNHTCDIGTGEGTFLGILGGLGYTGCFGIEPSTRCIQHARDAGLDVEQGVIQDIPRLRKNRLIDVITLFHVIEHLDNPEQEIKTLVDALPSGGHLVLETPNARGFCARKRGEQWDLYYPEHLWYFDDRTLPRFLEKCGLRIVAVGKRDFDPRGKSIPELLWRIGILRKDPSKTSALRHVKAKAPVQDNPIPPSPKPHSKGVRHWVLFFVRGILARLMQWSGNVDHVWVIAEKI